MCGCIDQKKILYSRTYSEIKLSLYGHKYSLVQGYSEKNILGTNWVELFVYNRLLCLNYEGVQIIAKHQDTCLTINLNLEKFGIKYCVNICHFNNNTQYIYFADIDTTCNLTLREIMWVFLFP